MLEPSAGTGMLAVMAQCALGNSAAGNLHLNEYARKRARLLTQLFPGAVVTAFDAEAIADRLRDVRPTVVLRTRAICPILSSGQSMAPCSILIAGLNAIAPLGTQKTFSARYSSGSSASASSSFSSTARFASKASEMYLRKIKPKATCL